MEERERCYTFILSRTPHESSSSSYPYPTKWGRYNVFFIVLLYSVHTKILFYYWNFKEILIMHHILGHYLRNISLILCMREMQHSKVLQQRARGAALTPRRQRHTLEPFFKIREIRVKVNIFSSYSFSLVCLQITFTDAVSPGCICSR
jgi:hypothetical protein